MIKLTTFGKVLSVLIILATAWGALLYAGVQPWYMPKLYFMSFLVQ